MLFTGGVVSEKLFSFEPILRRKNVSFFTLQALKTVNSVIKGSDEDGAQIDLLFDRNDDVVTLCEIKYTTAPYKLTKSEAQALLRKIEVFKKQTRTPKQVTIALITPQEPQETVYAQNVISGSVTLKDLMA